MFNLQNTKFVDKKRCFMDRRKEKSRQLIIDHFIKLMQKKDVAKISMKDIADAANINRGTIYLNFIDKYDILDQAIEYIMTDAIEACSHFVYERDNGKESIREILHVIDRQYDIFKRLTQKSDLNVLRQTLSNKFISNIQLRQNTNAIATQFLGSALVGVIVWWIENAKPCSIDELSEELWRLVEPHIEEIS